MVNQKLRADAKEVIEKIFIVIVFRLSERTPGDVPHRKKPDLLQLPFRCPSDPPEVGQRPVAPELLAVCLCVQLRNPHTIPVSRDMLGHDIHCNLAEVQVRTDARRCRDAGLVQDIRNQLPGKFVCGQSICVQIGCRIDEDLIDRIDMHILGRHVLQIDSVDPCARLHVEPHSGRSRDIVQLQSGIHFQRLVIDGCPRKCPSGRPALPLSVDCGNSRDHLKQPCPPRYPVAFQRWRDCKTDRLLRFGDVRHHQIGRQRIQSSGCALTGGEERLQVNCDIDFSMILRTLLHTFLMSAHSASDRPFHLHSLQSRGA